MTASRRTRLVDCNPTYASREAAIAAGALPELLDDGHFCASHGFVRDGQIEFCGDSR